MTEANFKVNAYLKAIPPGNKNPEKPKLLEYFVEGGSKSGDKAQLITAVEPKLMIVKVLIYS